MKILVTGASGFVGQHLIRFLKNKTDHIDGTFLRHKPEKQSHVVYHKIDFSKFHDVKKLIKKVKPTHIFHLVGQSSPSLSWKFPYETLISNTFSVIYLLEACRALSLKPRILFISSAHIYGHACSKSNRPSERDVPKPIDPYGATKLQAESFVIQYWQQFGIPSTIIRASAHIGEGQPPFFAISNFAKQIAEIEKGKQKPQLMVGNLKAERGFVSVKDMVRAYWLAIKKGKPGQIYNIGAKEIKPMGQWLEILLRFTSVRIQIIKDPARKHLIEIPKLIVNSTKFRQTTGWKEMIPLEKAFLDILNWWRSRV